MCLSQPKPPKPPAPPRLPPPPAPAPPPPTPAPAPKPLQTPRNNEPTLRIGQTKSSANRRRATTSSLRTGLNIGGTNSGGLNS